MLEALPSNRSHLRVYPWCLVPQDEACKERRGKAFGTQKEAWGHPGVPTLAFKEKSGYRGLSRPSGMHFLASAGSYLSKITASSSGFKTQITIFNKRRA